MSAGYKTQDLLQDCMADWRKKSRSVGKNPNFGASEFRDLFCRVCRNPVCVNHQADDPFAARISNQHERMTRPTQADPSLPKYANIVQADFANLLNQAVKLEISAKRNDWSPVEAPSFEITDGKPVANEPDVVDQAVRQLARAKGLDEPEFPNPAYQPTRVGMHEQDQEDIRNYGRNDAVWERAKELAGKKAHVDPYVQTIYDRLMSKAPPEAEEEAEPESPKASPAPQHPKKPIRAMPARGNAPTQGGMIGGAPEKPADDPWAVPVDPRKAGGRKVKAGARVKFTATGEIDDG